MYHFIVNPRSRTGKGMLVWNELEKILIEKNIAYQLHVTKCAGDATEIAKALSESGEQDMSVVMVGGDGTANEILQGIDSDKMKLAYLPIGSSNDLARGLKISSDEEKELRALLDRTQTKPYDFGVTVTKEGILRRFAVSSGLGFDAAVCKEALESPIKNFLNKCKLGKLTYGIIALKQIFTHKKLKMTFSVDDGEPFTYEDVLFAALMNHPYEGGGLCLVPQADGTDGELDLIIIHDIYKLRFLFMLPGAYSGKHVKHTKYVDIRRCKKVRMTADRPVPVHTDGEVPGVTAEMTCSVSEKKMQMIL